MLLLSVSFTLHTPLSGCLVPLDLVWVFCIWISRSLRNLRTLWFFGVIKVRWCFCLPFGEGDFPVKIW